MSRLSVLVVATILLGCAQHAAAQDPPPDKEKVLQTVNKLEERLQRVDLYLKTLLVESQAGKAEGAEAGAQLAEARAAANEHAEQARIAREALARTQSTVERRTEELKALQAQLQDYEALRARVQQAQKLEGRTADLEQALAKSRKQARENERAAAAAAARLQELRDLKARQQQFEQRLKDTQNRAAAEQAQRDELRHALAQREAALEASQQEMAELRRRTAELAELNQRHQNLAEELHATERRSEEMQHREADLRAALEDERTHRGALEQMRRDFEREMAAVTEDRDRQHAETARARDMVTEEMHEMRAVIERLSAENHELRSALEVSAQRAAPRQGPAGGVNLHIENHDNGDVEIHFHGQDAPRVDAARPSPRRGAAMQSAPLPTRIRVPRKAAPATSEAPKLPAKKKIN